MRRTKKPKVQDPKVQAPVAAAEKVIMVLKCIDHRFSGAIDHLEGEKLDADLCCHAGGSIALQDNLVSYESADRVGRKLEEIFKPDNGYGFVVNHVELTASLHGVREIHLVDHQDCGVYKYVYGDEYTKATPDVQLQFHTTNLKFAKQQLLKYIKSSATLPKGDYVVRIFITRVNGVSFEIFE